MTQEDIIRMAQEAGIDIGLWEKLDDQDTCFGYSIGGIHENLERFPELVVAHEREACAKYVESLMVGSQPLTVVMGAIGDAIRARGQA